MLLKKELFDGIGVEVNQLYASLNEEDDIHINGSVSNVGKGLKGNLLEIKANLCAENGEILYVLNTYSTMKFDLVRYDSFSMYCSSVSRFFDMDELHHVELYPRVKKEDAE